MATVAISTPDPRRRVQAAMGLALGVVAPESLALEDGRILLADRDLLELDQLRRVSDRLAQRIKGEVTDERLVVEAVALLGAELDRSRGGSSPVDGATSALDDLLAVPDLSDSFGTETRAMLRTVLETNELSTDDSRQRLAAVRAAERNRQRRAPLLDETVAASRAIKVEAELISRLATPSAAQPSRGRHRKPGGRHRRAARGPRPRQVGPTPAGAGLGTGSTTRLDEEQALNALLQVQPNDLGAGIAAPMRLQGRPRLAVVSTTDHGVQYFRLDLTEPGRGNVAATTLRAGTESDPHVLHLSPGVPANQLARVWTNQVSRSLQGLGERAAQSAGLFGRLRSGLSSRRRGRESANAARYSEFRHLSRVWRDEVLAGRDSRAVELELSTLAESIQRSGQPVPVMPWNKDAPQVMAPDRTAVPPEPNTLAHLREQVAAQLAGHERAAEELRARASTRTTSATTAVESAIEELGKADVEEGRHDADATARGRKIRDDAGKTLAKARRHTQIAANCEAAAVKADQARDAYQAMLTRLDELAASGDRPGPELAALAETAAGRVAEYQASHARTLPSPDIHATMTTSGQLPHLTRLTRELNTALAEQKNPHRFTPNMLRRLLRAETRRTLSPDGVVITVGNDPRADTSQLMQFQLHLKPGELREVLDAPAAFDEGQLGQLDQQSLEVASSVSRSLGYNAGYSLKHAVAGLPDTSLIKAGAEFVTPGAEVAVGRTYGVSTSAKDTGGNGAVEVIGGETLRYRSDHPEWTWRMRTSASGPWQEPNVVDSGDPHDADTLDFGVSHSYSVGPPERTTDLVTLGLKAERVTELPEHVATRVDGLNDLSDRAVVALRDRLGSLDRVGHDQLRGLLTEDAPTRLDECAKPGGIGRIITNGGRPVAYAQLQTDVVWDAVELMSDSSAEHQVEYLRVGFAGGFGSQSFGASSSYIGVLGGGGPHDLGESTVDAGLSARVGRNVGRTDGLNTGDLAIHPSVQRKQPTVGYKARLVHKLSVHRIDRDEKFSLDSAGDAILRMPENEAFRYGLPVPDEALVRGPDGHLQRGSDGRILLRGDAQPTEEKIGLPGYLGHEAGQMRGAGPALVQELTGADSAFKQFLQHLSDEEMIPPVDPKTGRPILSALQGKNPAQAASMLANLDRVVHQLSKRRLEAGYDQAAQGGILLELSKHRTGLPPQVHSYRIKIHQHFDQAKLIGLKTGDTVVNLDIGSNTSGRSGGRSKSLALLGKLGFSDKPGPGQAGSAPEVGGSYGRTLLGRFMNWAGGGTVNRVSLTQSSAEVAEFDVPQTLVVTEVTANGDSDPLAASAGRARLAIDSEFCHRGERPSLSIGGPVDPQLLQQATFQHVDAGDPLSRITAALPAAARGDSAAMHHLAGFLHVSNLRARPELLTSEYRTKFALSPTPSDPLQAVAQRGLAPREASLAIRTRLENLTYVGSGHPIVGEINLTLSSSSFTTGTSGGQNAGVSAGTGSVWADGDTLGGSAGAGGNTSTSASQTRTTIGGIERLAIKDGQHYQFTADLVLEAEVQAFTGAKPETVPLENGKLLLTLPERDALRMYSAGKLDLPLAKVSDAVERVIDDNLVLDRRVVTALVRRYHADKQGITDGLAGTHTDERLQAKLRELADLSKSPTEHFDQTLESAETITRERVEARLPRHYRNTMGLSLIDRSSLQDQAGVDTDPLAEVRAAIAEHSPGALDDPALAAALRGELAGKRWYGHIDDMLDPRGFVKEYPIAGEGTESPRALRVRVRAVFAGPATTDGRPDNPAAGSTENAFNIIQVYDYAEESRSVTETTGYSGNVGGASSDELAGSAGLSTDLSTSTTATSATQNTRMTRALALRTKRVERDYKLVVEVEEVPVQGGATKGKLKQAAERSATPREATQRESHGRLAQLVPAAVINAEPPAQFPEVTDHRTVSLPSAYLVEGTQAYRTGDPEVDTLFDAVYARLGRSDMLTAAGARMHQTTLENMLSASARTAAFERIASAEGHRLVELPVPGHGSRAVRAGVRAEISGLELIADPDETVQLGEIDRQQRITQLTTKSNRLLPTTRTGGAEYGDAKGGVTSGEQATERVTDTTGPRNETSKFETGEIVTVKVDVDYHLDFERLKLNRRGDPKVDRSDSVHKAATGEAYLTMFRHEYDEMRARMEAGLAPLQNWDPSRTRKQPKLRTLRVEAGEMVAGSNGQAEYKPYQALVDALATARREGAVVELTLYRRNGDRESYWASPKGTLTGPGENGEFGAAFATLHPRLALLAEGRVDLRDLHHAGNRNGRFTGAVVEALQKQGIPASALTELDHRLTKAGAATVPPETEAAGQHAPAVGRAGSGVQLQ